jgi:macrolide transport system ATP-binding/permease protein
MIRLRIFFHRLLGLFLRRKLERELEEEIRSHLEMQIEDNLRQGMSPEDARRAARLRFGGAEQVKEAYLDKSRLGWIESLWQDLRYGARMLRRNPGFTLIAALTLGLGVGANTAIFSFVNSLFLRPLAVTNPEQVVRLYAEDSRGRKFDVFSYPNYADLRDRSQTLQALAGHGYTDASVGLGAGAEETPGEVVTGNYFDLLGVSAALGRALLPEDDLTPGANPVVVISHAFWLRRLGADRNAVGRKLYINGHPFTVVGVMPEGFKGTYQNFPADFWAPMMMQGQVQPIRLLLNDRSSGWLGGTARLKPGVTLAQAQAELDRLANQLRQEHPNVNRYLGFRFFHAGALHEEFRQGASRMLKFFMAVVGLALLAACANIAGLLLALMVARQREMAVRQSLGAARGRLIRQLLIESLLLAFSGAVAGLLFAVWLIDGLTALAPPDFRNFSPAQRLDARVLIFTLAVSVVAGVLCGLFPALRASRSNLVAALKEGRLAASGGRHSSRLQQVFVVTQVAVSLTLLVVAGLLLRSLQNSAAFDPGFKKDNLLLARFDLRRHGYSEEQGQAFYRRLIERSKSLPGAGAVTTATIVPLGAGRETRGYRIPGHVPPNGDSLFSIGNNNVGPGYFAAIGIPILRGRDFDARDEQPGARPVAIINETMARRFWPNADAVGQSIQPGGNSPPMEIIGVARDIKYYSLAEEPQPYVYTSAAQLYAPYLTLHMRTAGDLKTLANAVRKEVERLDPNVAIAQLTTFAELRQAPLFPSRAMATVSSLFGLLALLLAAVGIYGITSYMVGQRTREVGIRIALGAERGDIFRLIVGHGVVTALVGVGVGLGAALALTRFLSSQLFGVSAFDPLTFAGVSLLLTFVALMASWIPARRATKVDPLIAIKYE